MKTVLFIFVIITVSCFAFFSSNSFTQDLVMKIGNKCPQHYAPDGNYCKPLPGAKEIIPKIGYRCPRGFAPDGAYCYRVSAKPAQIIPKSGSKCPKGFMSDGDYCCSLN